MFDYICDNNCYSCSRNLCSFQDRSCGCDGVEPELYLEQSECLTRQRVAPWREARLCAVFLGQPWLIALACAWSSWVRPPSSKMLSVQRRQSCLVGTPSPSCSLSPRGEVRNVPPHIPCYPPFRVTDQLASLDREPFCVFQCITDLNLRHEVPFLR